MRQIAPKHITDDVWQDALRIFISEKTQKIVKSMSLSLQMEFFSLATQATEGELTEEKKMLIGHAMSQNELYAWESRQGMT